MTHVYKTAAFIFFLLALLPKFLKKMDQTQNDLRGWGLKFAKDFLMDVLH